MNLTSLEELAARVETLERKNRRMKRFSAVFFALFLFTAGWVSYQSIVDVWHPGTMTQGVTLYQEKPFSFGEMATLRLGGAVLLPENRGFRGSIGAYPRHDYTGLYFTNGRRYQAGLNVTERGAFLTLQDSTNAVYLGPGLYDDGQLLLELISRDGQQGVRLGLDGDQRPIFQVIRDGATRSLLEGSPGVGSVSTRSGGASVRDVVHE